MEREWQRTLGEDPINATYLGETRYNGSWPDLSDVARARAQARDIAVLRKLATLPRSALSEAEQFYTALKLRKIDTALVRVPGAPHDISARPSNLIDKMAFVLAWFAAHDRKD